MVLYQSRSKKNIDILVPVTMYDHLSMLLLGFVIGLSGALAPGPTLVATINASLAGSWTAGLRISLGHMVAEAAIFLLIIMGFAAVALPYTAVIAAAGGFALIVFGIMTILGSRSATMSLSPARAVSSPFAAGLVTSIANPYFWIWWLTIGSAMVIAGLQGGLLLAGVFMIGHWGADIGWFTLVSAGVSRGRTILEDRTYRLVMASCGIFLVFFGGYYLSRFIIPS
jgi:threonine/homoserine/homoserine lactone efflux protein